MECKFCGAQLPENSQKCEYCGSLNERTVPINKTSSREQDKKIRVGSMDLPEGEESSLGQAQQENVDPVRLVSMQGSDVNFLKKNQARRMSVEDDNTSLSPITCSVIILFIVLIIFGGIVNSCC